MGASHLQLQTAGQYLEFIDHGTIKWRHLARSCLLLYAVVGSPGTIRVGKREWGKREGGSGLFYPAWVGGKNGAVTTNSDVAYAILSQ